MHPPTPDHDNIPPELHQTYWCTEKQLNLLRKNRRENQPWMLSINPFDPHPPFDAPWEYYRRYDPETLPGPHFQESDIAFQSKLTDAGIDFQSQAKPPSEWDDKRMQASYYAMIDSSTTNSDAHLIILMPKAFGTIPSSSSHPITGKHSETTA